MVEIKRKKNNSDVTNIVKTNGFLLIHAGNHNNYQFVLHIVDTNNLF